LTRTLPPQILGLGAQKSATSWLHKGLQSFTQLRFPFGKEAHFWNREPPPLPLPDYLAAMQDARWINADITPAYSMLSVEQVQNIARHLPEAQCILLLRNPIERAWSSANMALGRAEMQFHEASEQWFLDHFSSHGSRARGNYPHMLRTWAKVYGDAFHVYLYDDIAAAPAQTFTSICADLGLTPTPSQLLQTEEIVFGGTGRPLPKRLRHWLCQAYAEVVEETSQILGQDLTHWLQALD
jgi:hypothetical protein